MEVCGSEPAVWKILLLNIIDNLYNFWDSTSDESRRKNVSFNKYYLFNNKLNISNYGPTQNMILYRDGGICRVTDYAT
jgi:hypothetical protein